MMSTVERVPLWKTDAFRRWWEQDFSWNGLVEHGLLPTQSQFGNVRDYWKSIDPQEYSFGKSPRKWSRFHLPPFDLDGEPCPRELWEEAKGEKLTKAVHSLLENANVPDDKTVAEPEFSTYDNSIDLRGAVFEGNGGDIRFLPFDTKPILAAFDFCVFIGFFEGYRQTFLSTFPSCIFESGARFNESHFPAYSIFHFSTFRDRSYFTEAKLNWADFTNAQFEAWSAFYSVDFRGPAHFRETKFLVEAAFDGTTFHSNANFSRCEFLGAKDPEFRKDSSPVSASFINARFERDLIGSGAIFATGATFRGSATSTIGGRSKFSGTTFKGSVDFSGRTFLDSMEFDQTHFGGLALFHGCTLHPEAFFDENCFQRAPNIEQILIQLRTDLASTTAAPASPTLGKATPKPTIRSRFVRSISAISQAYRRFVAFALPFPLRWPGMRLVRLEYDKESARYEYAFRSLRLASGANKNIEQESMFYRMELDARTSRPNLPIFEKLITWAYKFISLYGQSMTRPLVVFSLAFVVSVWAHIFAALGSGVSLAADDLSSLVYWTFRQFIPPPLVWSEQEMANAPVWVNTIWAKNPDLLFALGTVQVVAFITLVTAFLIALRRRFQLS